MNAIEHCSKPDPRPKTIFLDIDGCLLKHAGSLPAIIRESQEGRAQALPGVIEQLDAWDRQGYQIILTTGRKECMRTVTQKALTACGIFYDQLIMGVEGGVRVLINDKKPSGEITAIAVNLDRDQGLQGIQL